MTNTLKHADASNLWVEFSDGDQGLTLTIRDDGKGCRVPSGGSGLTGMRERLESAGGDLEIVTGAGQGFVLAARLPVTSKSVGDSGSDTISQSSDFVKRVGS